MKLLTFTALFCAGLLPLSQAHATSLITAYQQAADHNAQYQAAKETYLAAKEGVPIAKGALLPSVNIVGSGTGFTRDFKTKKSTRSFELTVTQPLIDVSDWATYSEAQFGVKAAAITYAQAEKSLMLSTSKAYFAVLEAQDKLEYAQANQKATQENYLQAEQQFKVGLKANSDVQTAKANYETAIAATVANQNDVHNALQSLAAIMGKAPSDLAPLKANFPKAQPYPANVKTWVQAALKNNLSLMAAHAKVNIDQSGVRVAQGAYYPSADLTGDYDRNHTSGTTTESTSAAVTLNWNLFNGGSTTATVSQAKNNLLADKASDRQQQRNIASKTASDYRSVLSDVQQIAAFGQAIQSGKASVAAAKAQYIAGTSTIYDLLQEQSKLFQTQQQYAQANYQYIMDSLTLKDDIGALVPKDLQAINQWLIKGK